MLSEHATQVSIRERRGNASRMIWIPRVLVVLLFLIAYPFQQGSAAPLAQDVMLVITSPREGATLSGQVAIQGTATRPSFVSYGVLYAPGSNVTGETSWQQNNPIAWNVQSMVVNGVLGVWDTTQIPNGSYVLALVMFEAGNETPMVYFVNNLIVNNDQPTPTPEPSPTPEEGESPDALGPTQEPGPPPPAATIVQPPTATPRPTPTLGPDDIGGPAGADGGDDGGSGLFAPGLFSMEAIKEAATLGAQLAFLIYAIGALYVLAKAVIRYYLRQTRRKAGS